jgi:transcriptional regulator with XRE-family HTH domain
MPDTYKLQVEASNEKSYNLCNARLAAPSHIASMKKRGENPPNHLAKWRHFRRLSQADLGELAGTTGSMIHHLENGDRALSHKWLMRLAPALGTTPGFLLDHDPFDLPNDLFDIWNRSSIEQKQQITSVAEALVPFRAEPRG